MTVQEKKSSRKDRQKFWSDFFRLLVLYPLAWIVLSLMLFYIVKIY